MNCITYRVSVFSSLKGIDKQYHPESFLTIEEAIKFGEEKVKDFQSSSYILARASANFTIHSSHGIEYDSAGKQISGRPSVPDNSAEAPVYADQNKIKYLVGRALLGGIISSEQAQYLVDIGMLFSADKDLYLEYSKARAIVRAKELGLTDSDLMAMGVEV